MKLKLYMYLVIPFVLTSSPIGAQNSPESDVRDLLSTVAASFQSGDLQPLDDLFAPGRGVHIIEGAGVNHGWAEYRDEHLRPETTLEGLARLRAPFKEGGSVTAGNASGVNDGACAMVLASKEAIEKHGLVPRAKVISMATAGVEPRIMGFGPAPATKKLLEKTGMSLEQVDLIELNEAFASQSLAVIRELGLNPEITNVNGGAIAMGHPLGATGARLSLTILNELKRRNKKYGMVTACVGGGQGIAGIIERID